MLKVTLVKGKGEVDGVYRLLEEATEKRDEVCVDGCVYSKVTFFSAARHDCRTRSLGASTALPGSPRWRRVRRWPVMLEIRNVDEQCSNGGSDKTQKWKQKTKR